MTWIFQDDFVPRAKITKEGCYSIMTDYLGTPVEAYDEEGTLVIKNTLIIEDDNMRRVLVEAVIENRDLHLIKDGEEDNEVVIRYGEFIQE